MRISAAVKGRPCAVLVFLQCKNIEDEYLNTPNIGKKLNFKILVYICMFVCAFARNQRENWMNQSWFELTIPQFEFVILTPSSVYDVEMVLFLKYSYLTPQLLDSSVSSASARTPLLRLFSLVRLYPKYPRARSPRRAKVPSTMPKTTSRFCIATWKHFRKNRQLSSQKKSHRDTDLSKRAKGSHFATFLLH